MKKIEKDLEDFKIEKQFENEIAKEERNIYALLREYNHRRFTTATKTVDSPSFIVPTIYDQYV